MLHFYFSTINYLNVVVTYLILITQSILDFVSFQYAQKRAYERSTTTPLPLQIIDVNHDSVIPSFIKRKFIIHIKRFSGSGGVSWNVELNCSPSLYSSSAQTLNDTG